VALCVGVSSTAASSWPDDIPYAELVLELAVLSESMYSIFSIDSENIPDDVTRTELFKEVEDDDGSSDVLVGTFRLDVNGVDKDHIFVALRGTDEGSDWNANADFGTAKLGPPGSPVLGSNSPVRVHRGFNIASFSIYDDIDLAVQSILNSTDSATGGQSSSTLAYVDGKPAVYFTGHSKGGGEAQIISTYMAHSYPDLSIQMVNFGSPQVGNAGFKRWAERLENLSSFRFVLRADLVPRLPPFYAKCGHLMQMERSSITAYWRQDGGGDGFVGIPLSWNWGMSIDDHRMFNYVGFLQELFLDPNIYYPRQFERRGEQQGGRNGKNCCTLWVFNCKPC